MARLAISITVLCAVVSLVGGILGYVNKGSTASLIAGVAAGVLLGVGAWFGQAGRLWGLILALVVAIGLVGNFLPKYLKDTSAIWPAGIMSGLGIVTAVVLLLAILSRRG